MKIPPPYSITPEIIEVLGKIEAIRQYLKTLVIPDETKRKIQRISILKSSVYSAKIEGNPLNLENYKNSPDKLKKLEIENLSKAIDFISKNKINFFNQKTIKNTHKLVLKGINSEAGIWRREISAIFNEAGVPVYVPPPPTMILNLIEQLIAFINSQDEKFPLIKAFISHLIFVKIHPFIDGNGRVGRLMIYQICQVDGYEFNLLVPFEEYVNNNKNDYYYFLDVGFKNTNDYLLFMLKAFYFQAEKLKAEVEQEINKKDNLRLAPRQEEIFNIIKDHKSISLDFIKRRFLKVPKRTLRYDLKKLAEKGLIIKIGNTKGSFYSKA